MVDGWWFLVYGLWFIVTVWGLMNEVEGQWFRGNELGWRVDILGVADQQMFGVQCLVLSVEGLVDYRIENKCWGFTVECLVSRI
jgi:hypothetical protein